MCVWGGSDLNDFPAVGDARSLSLSLNQIKLPSVIPPTPTQSKYSSPLFRNLGGSSAPCAPPLAAKLERKATGLRPGGQCGTQTDDLSCFHHESHPFIFN